MKLKSWGIFIVVAMGFLAGMVLAGVGGISAKTLFNKTSDGSSQRKSIEDYWSETQLGMHELAQLISNDNCYSSEKYFLSCVNAVIQNANNLGFVLSEKTGRLIRYNITNDQVANSYEEFTEKKKLLPFLDFFARRSQIKIDFINEIQTLIDAEAQNKKYALAAAMINSFLSVYKDPHTYIMPDNYYDEVGSQLERSNLFVGLSFEKINNSVYIRKVFKNSDADFYGLKENDEVVSINGRSTKHLMLSEASQLLRDELQKSFQFVVQREQKIEKITVYRRYQNLSHVQFEVLAGPKNFANIILTKFNRGVCEEVARKLKSVSERKIEGLILDLRDNPGGQLDEAACLAGLFIGMNKKTYSIEFFDPLKTGEVVLSTGSLLYTGPMVVLQNSSSASASELLAGALKLYKRALIVGEVSFGKGTFQEAEPWTKNSKVSLFRTQGFYLLPDKSSTQLRGVTPDYVMDDKHPDLRESGIYFNPIASPEMNSYIKENDLISKTEQINFALNKCIEKFEKQFNHTKLSVTYEFQKIVQDDTFVKKAIDILSCNQLTSVMASQFNTEIFEN